MSDVPVQPVGGSTVLTDTIPWFERLKQQFGSSLSGNGLALVAGSAIASVLGLIFWLVVARSFSQTEVGVGAAIVATMMALSHAAQLNLRNLIHRYVPTAGKAAATFIRLAYAGAAAGALALGSGFVVLSRQTMPDLAFIGQSIWLSLGFVTALTIWTLYALQEAVLTGLRLSRIVPVQSLIYSVSKIVFVLLAALWAPSWAAGGINILAVWVAPAALIGFYVHGHIQRELRDVVRISAPAGERLTRSSFWRFFGWDYAGSLATSVAYGLVPLLVLSMSGAASSAQYQMAWTISYSLYLVGRHLGAAMQAEIGRHSSMRRGLYASALVYTLGLVIPAVLIIVVFAPQIMSLFGADYVAEGTTLLRLLALATLPLSILTVMLAIARAENFFVGVAVVQVASLVLAVGLGALLLAQIGTTGMAWAWLLTHSLVLAGSLGWFGIKTGSVGVKSALIDIVSALSRIRDFAFAYLPTNPQFSLSDARTEIGPVVSKRSDTTAGMAALQAEYRALTILHDDGRLSRFRDILPRVENFDAGRLLQTSRIVGTEGRNLHGDETRAALLAVNEIAALHKATASVETIGRNWLENWIEAPLAVINMAEKMIDPVCDKLSKAFFGTRTALGLGHCDFCLDNLIFKPDRIGPNSIELAGIVDWGQSRLDAPALVDPVHLVMTLRMRAANLEFGQVVIDLLSVPHLTLQEESILGTTWQVATVEERQALVLLVWLNHVSNNITKSDRYQAGTYWYWANVQLVVEAVSDDTVVSPTFGEAPTYLPRTKREPTETEPRSKWQMVIVVLLLFASLGLWVLHLPNVRAGNMGELGLITILPNAILLAYALLIFGFVLSLSGPTPLRAMPMLFLAALVLLLHATPAISYETLRYSWAWKHVGVIDYILRTGQLDPTAQFLSAYFNWPLFFLAAAGVAKLIGLDASGIADLARFFPVVLNFCYALALFGIFKNLGADRRMSYIGVSLFLLGNWVGQDYFSPQGTAFLFYLGVIFLVTGPLMQNASGWQSRLFDWIEHKLGFTVQPDNVPAVSNWTPLLQILTLVLIGAIIAMHQLTPLLMLSAFFGLSVIGRLRIELLLFGLIAELLWLFYFADNFMAGALADILDSFGAVGSETVGRLVDLDVVSDSQRLVAVASRSLTAAVTVLGMIGGMLRLWRRQLDITALVLLLAPVPLMVATPYGGEIVFRAYFFALPFIAFFAGAVFVSPVKMGWVRGLALVLAMALMVPGFILANNGKDLQYRFTSEEVAASVWLYSRAQPGELLIEGSRSYPSQFRNYENFIYVPLSEELPEIATELSIDAAGLVTRWLSNAPNGGYVIITRSMKAMFDSLGLLPLGGLERIERALFAAPQLKVAYSNNDAVIFMLRE